MSPTCSSRRSSSSSSNIASGGNRWKHLHSCLKLCHLSVAANTCQELSTVVNSCQELLRVELQAAMRICCIVVTVAGTHFPFINNSLSAPPAPSLSEMLDMTGSHASECELCHLSFLHNSSITIRDLEPESKINWQGRRVFGQHLCRLRCDSSEVAPSP